MSELREYRVNLNGHETTQMLTDEDAKRLGGVLVNTADTDAATAAPPVANKARPAANSTRGRRGGGDA